MLKTIAPVSGVLTAEDRAPPGKKLALARRVSYSKRLLCVRDLGDDRRVRGAMFCFSTMEPVVFFDSVVTVRQHGPIDAPAGATRSFG